MSEAPIPMPRLDRVTEYPPEKIINPEHDPSLGNDGGCTGFPNKIGEADWTHCCVEHDLGGRDGALADCIQDAAPGLPIAAVLFCVFLMALVRPIYKRGQRWGWWR